MKTLLLFTLFVTPLFAQDFSVLNRAASGPNAMTCEDCADTPNCPQNIVKDVLNGNLTFMGRDLLPGSDQNRSCVFRGPTAYVIYINCMGSKKEAPTTDIRIIPFTGGQISFYVENRAAGAISTLSRSQYDGTWKVSLEDTPVPGQLTMDGLKTYMSSLQAPGNIRRGCFVGMTDGARNSTAAGLCYGGYSNTQWVKQAESFWADPGPQWPSTLQRLRQKVISSY